ncbi:MAG: FUSC family protein, partial [Pseudomonas aeruginosa]|nr:FUSC family protein [Pseudomonas aeruginosa]
MRLHEGAEDEVVLNGLNAPSFLLCDSEGLWITEDSTHNARALLLPPDGPLQVIARRLRSAQSLLPIGPGRYLLAEQGRAVPSEVLEEFQAVRQAFDAAATRAESYDEALSPALRPQVAILRWEYARLFQRLGEVLELNDAIQSGRHASSFYRRGQAQALHLDWALASMNAVRAFVALSCAAWLWITSAWNGALSSLLLVGVMCSLMATFPRPLLAAQNFLRGLLLAILISAALLFVLLPASADFEWLALWMALLLYVVAVGLSSPLSAGIAMGIGLETLLMVAPQNIAVYYSNASQWFEFVGGFLAAAVLAVLVFALV